MKYLLTILILLPILVFAGTIELRLSFSEDATQSFYCAPGRVRVPVQNVNVLLPPGAELVDYQFEFGPATAARHSYAEINPVWHNGEEVIYTTRSSHVPEGYKYLGIKRWGDLSYASFQVLPYDHARHAWTPTAQLTIRYTSDSSARNLIPGTFKQPSFFTNQSRLRDWYQTADSRNYDYLVISTPALYAALGDWVSYRQSQGLAIQFADINSILATQLGANDAEKMRNFMVTEYMMQPFTYLMIVGDYDTVPVAFLTPEPNGYDTVPSDFFYSDLTSNWDSDNDGRYGEYSSGIGEGDWEIDFTPEIFVGRLSTNSATEVSAIASRIVAFDSSNEPYKSKALLPAAFLNYSDEPEIGMPQTDGADFFQLAKNTVLRHFDNTTLYEQLGVVASHPSDYPLDYSQFNTLLRGTDYGLINWSAHGSSVSSSRKVWMEDVNGNNIPDSYEMQWMNLVNKQSFSNLTATGGSVIFAASCYNGRIDGNESSLGEYALIKKAVGVIAATRTGWYKVGWQNPGWGGLSSYNYHFLENYAEAGHSLGAAHAHTNLLHTQYYLFGDPIDSGGIIWPELQNVYTYILYGDPAIGHNTMPAPEGEILVYIPTGEADSRVINSIRDTADMNVVYSNRLIPDYDYISNFEAVFAIMDDYQLAPWEKDILNAYLDAGGKMYLEGNINWDSSDPFLGKFGVEAPLDIVISIETLQYPQKAWEYADQSSSYRVLVPVQGGATPLFYAGSLDPTAYCVGTLNETATYNALAAEFRLMHIAEDATGYASFTELIHVILSELGVINGGTSNDDALSPVALSSISAWPNPARGSINIKLENPLRSETVISIYNLKGQLVNSLELSAKNSFQVNWNSLDTNGKPSPAGVYILKGAGTERKITVLR